MVNLNSPMEIAMRDMTRLIDLANSKADTIPDVINANGPMYGAKPDAADNTAALQKAIDAAKAAGRSEVYLSPGHYDYTSLTNTDGIVIVGDGVTLSGSPTLPVVSTSQLADMSLSVKSFGGAKGDGITDDTAAIQRTIEAAAAIKGVVYFPEGTYRVRLVADTGCLFLRSNTIWRGAGKNRSIIKLVDDTQTWIRMIIGREVENVIVESLGFDGNRGNVYDHEQMHMIYLDTCSNVTFRDCLFYQPRGDCVLIRGPIQASENITIMNCEFYGTGRNAVTLGSGYKNVKILYNKFHGPIEAQMVDSEPNDGTVTSFVLVEGNQMDGSEGGGLITFISHETDRNISFTVRKNELINVSLYTRFGYNITIEDNYFYRDVEPINDAYHRNLIRVSGLSGRVNIKDNYLYNNPPSNGSDMAAIYVERIASDSSGAGGVPEDVKIAFNSIISNKAVFLSNCNGVHIVHNEMTTIDATTDYPAITIRATATADSDSAWVSQNRIVGYDRGIELNTANNYSFHSIKILHNIFKDCISFGIWTANNSMVRYPDFEYAGNSFVGSVPTSPFRWSTGAWYKMVASSETTPEIIVVSGSPEGVRTAPPGTIAIDRNGGTGVTMYVKETGTGNTGWVAK